MTIPQSNPFQKHFKNNKLLRISSELLNNAGMENVTTLIFMQGRLVEWFDRGMFVEIKIQDEVSEITLPVVSFEKLDCKSEVTCALICVGSIHYNWTPDLRCGCVCYPVALKAHILRLKWMNT